MSARPESGGIIKILRGSAFQPVYAGSRRQP
jgi:hypothetical protein